MLALNILARNNQATMTSGCQGPRYNWTRELALLMNQVSLPYQDFHFKIIQLQVLVPCFQERPKTLLGLAFQSIYKQGCYASYQKVGKFLSQQAPCLDELV